MLALCCHGAPHNQEPLDLSILEERNTLRQTMNASQRVTLLKLEAAVEKAASDIQSADYLIQTKISAFRDQKEVQEMVKQGEAQKKIAEIELDTAQRELVAFLTNFNSERDAQLAVAAKKFNFTLESTTYEKAFTQSTKSLLAFARTKGYSTVLFDHIFISDRDGTKRISAQARNQAYDTIVDIDGTHFTVSVPQNLKLNESSELTFDGAQSYEGKKLALLAIELIDATAEQGLLFMRLLDIQSHEIINHTLIPVSAITPLANTEDEEGSEEVTMAVETEKASEDPLALTQAAPLPIGAQILDTSMWIDRLALLPYSFQIVSATSESLVPQIYLAHAVTTNTDMRIADDGFLQRAYGDTEQTFTSQASAELKLSAHGEAHALSALSYNNDRVIAIGTFSLVNE